MCGGAAKVVEKTAVCCNGSSTAQQLTAHQLTTQQLTAQQLTAICTVKVVRINRAVKNVKASENKLLKSMAVALPPC